MTKPLVSIILLNWNGYEDTLEALESLYQINYPKYNVIVADNNSTNDSVEKIGVNIDPSLIRTFSVDDVKPYLFPLSSMSDEQKVIYGDLCYAIIHSLAWDMQAALNELVDWLNKNHFDYNNLIPKGLANDATNLNIY